MPFDLGTGSFAQRLPRTFQPEQYPHSMGFVDVAAAFEKCIYEPDCHELEAMPLDQQLLIVQITHKVLNILGVDHESGM